MKKYLLFLALFFDVFDIPKPKINTRILSKIRRKIFGK